MQTVLPTFEILVLVNCIKSYLSHQEVTSSFKNTDSIHWFNFTILHPYMNERPQNCYLIKQAKIFYQTAKDNTEYIMGGKSRKTTYLEKT